ncbi:MAG TPA: response regulator [Candidatus Paceibacterota bacterium]|jgi:CheY-like chemotaxis protein|nr:response regulator [Candidatus Paceibacterota bacterium]
MDSLPKHILIIDDDMVSRRLFGSLLGRAGYEVIYAKDGDEGREVARRLHPDLILLDINMSSGPDGYKTANSIKNEPNSPAADIPIVFLTNADLPIEMLKWMKDFGVTDYIHKGVTNEEFVERVKKILDAVQKVI